MRSHEKVGPTRTRGGRKYADEVKPSEDAAAKPIPLRRQTIYYLKTLSSPNISLIFEICFLVTSLFCPLLTALLNIFITFRLSL